MALPTANKKEGNTRSVGVKPCHCACSSGAKGVAPLPGVFTIIIKQMVMPRNTSNAKKRSDTLFINRVFIVKDWVKCYCKLRFLEKAANGNFLLGMVITP